jgi:PTH2 family peptidyl-tRNA hydrolase
MSEETKPKQVMIYRADLTMRKGKIAAQCAHASMAAFFNRGKIENNTLTVPLTEDMQAWLSDRFTKIVLSCEDEAALLTLRDMAAAAGLPHALITDSGLTEFRGVPTNTVVAIGPAMSPLIDVICGPSGAVKCKLA